jgi:tetratricopeptide (TPR) repeat protein
LEAPIVTKSFFISYTKRDASWAEWIAWQLESAGYSTVLQRWDFLAGSNFVTQMRSALEECDQTLAVLTPAYLQSAYAQVEWTAAFAHGVSGGLPLLIVTVEDVTKPKLLLAWVSIDLVGLEPAAARQKLLREIAQQRRKPIQEPPFPGTSGSVEPVFPGRLPRVWQAPFSRNPVFTGRDDLLARTSALLDAPHDLPIVVALFGMGGVGKTQVALELAYRRKHRYHCVWWIRADQHDTLRQDYSDLGRQLDLGLSAEEQADSRVVIAAVKEWLECHDQWLLILDNAEDVSSVRSLLPRRGGGGVLVTSRNPDWLREAVEVEVEVFARSESLNFLLRRAGRGDHGRAARRAAEDEDARRIAQELGDMPLALDQAAGYINEQNISFSRYLELLAGRKIEVLEKGRSLDYDGTLTSTYLIIARNLEVQSPAALQLLWLCAHFHPDGIMVDVIEQSAHLLPLPLRDVARSRERLDECLAQLYRYSLVKLVDGTVSMHRLAQETARRQMDEATQRVWAEYALWAISRLFPEDSSEPSTWRLCALLLPHALSVMRYDKWSSSAPAATVMRARVAEYQKARSEIEEAIASLEAALSEHKSDHSEPLGDDAEIQFRIGMFQLLLGRAEGVSTLERGFDWKCDRFGAESLESADAAEYVGRLLSGVEPDKAGQYLQHSLRIRKQVLGERDSSVAHVHAAIGRLNRRSDINAARTAYKLALDVAREAPRPDEEFILDVLQELGVTIAALDDFAGAEGVLSELVERVSGRADGQGFARLVNALAVRGEVQFARREFAAAAGSYEQAIDGYRQRRTEEDEIPRGLYRRLAQIYLAAGKNRQAHDAYRRALTTENSSESEAR